MGMMIGSAIALSGVFLSLPIPPPFPLTNTIPGFAIICLSLGLMEKDGGLILCGYVLTAIAADLCCVDRISWQGGCRPTLADLQSPLRVLVVQSHRNRQRSIFVPGDVLSRCREPGIEAGTVGGAIDDAGIGLRRVYLHERGKTASSREPSSSYFHPTIIAWGNNVSDAEEASRQGAGQDAIQNAAANLSLASAPSISCTRKSHNAAA